MTLDESRRQSNPPDQPAGTDSGLTLPEQHAAPKAVDPRAEAGGRIVIGDVIGASGIAVGRDIIHVYHSDPGGRPDLPIISADQAFERIGAAVRSNIRQLEDNMTQARRDSGQFFRMTLIFASLGFIVVIGGVVPLLVQQVTAGVVTTIAGVIPEATAALFFQKDKELRKTIEAYHQHILDSQQILTMVDVAETIAQADERDKMKQQIIYRVLRIAPPA